MIFREIPSRLLLLSFLWAALFTQSIHAQILLEKGFQVDAESEVLLDLKAVSRGTSWEEAGKEAAAATIFVDGRYHQDLILFAGSGEFTYALMLGRLGPGSHSLRVEYSRRHSAEGAGGVEIRDAKISMIDRGNAEFQAISLAPLLYARANTIGRFSDVPILAWYETLRSGSGTTIRYSVIFTNEDGGTQTNALMARWGRTTDIELIYEALIDPQGKLVSSTFQGKDHETFQFRGKKEAGHPLYLVSTNNNMFSDQGQSELRFALRPVPFDLSSASREEIMFQHPWTYSLMAQEMKREGKLNESSRVGQQIADLRRYLYIQAGSTQQDAALSFAVKLKGDRRWYTSDIGINYYKVDRSGYFQTTVRLPAEATLERIERIAVRCDVAGDPRSWQEISKVKDAGCDLKEIKRIFMLDGNFLPGSSLPVQVKPLAMRFGDMVEVY